jgi:hypothetical protein
MDKEEFMKLAELRYLSVEDYERIKTVYANIPGIRTEEQMARIIKQYGLPLIDLVLPLAKDYEDLSEAHEKAIDDLYQLEVQHRELEQEHAKMTAVAKAYCMVFPDDAILAKVVKEGEQ